MTMIMAYVCQDSALGTCSFRALRALARFEWADSTEIGVALDLATRHEWNALSAALTRFVRNGFVRRRQMITLSAWLSGKRAASDHMNHEYRITKRGRVELARLVRRANNWHLTPLAN